MPLICLTCTHEPCTCRKCRGKLNTCGFEDTLACTWSDTECPGYKPAESSPGVTALSRLAALAECLKPQLPLVPNDAAEQVSAAVAELTSLRAIIASSLPYLEEAWKACFHGQESRMLSCEERGMGRLLSIFREIAAGKPTLPPGLVTTKEANERVDNALAWAYRTLGSPNALREPLQRWTRAGETLADGMERANAAVERLRAEMLDVANFAAGHHSDQDKHVLLHALTVDIPEWLRSYASREEGEVCQ